MTKKTPEVVPVQDGTVKKWTRFDAAWLAFRKDKAAIVTMTLSML